MGSSTQHTGATKGGSPSRQSGEATSTKLDRDELFHVLRNQRRRFAIHHLKRDSKAVEVGELATQVAAWENEIPVEEVTSKQRRRVYNALNQTHIPELDDKGIVEVDRQEVELTDQAEQLDIYLEVVSKRDIRWSEYYLGLGAVGLTLFTLTGLNFGPFASISNLAVGAFLSVALVVSATANYYYYQRQSLVGSEDEPPEIRGG